MQGQGPSQSWNVQVVPDLPFDTRWARWEVCRPLQLRAPVEASLPPGRPEALAGAWQPEPPADVSPEFCLPLRAFSLVDQLEDTDRTSHWRFSMFWEGSYTPPTVCSSLEKA